MASVSILGTIVIVCPCVLARRRQRRRLQEMLASGRIGIVIPALVVGPIIENDELQNEHERHVNNPSRNGPPPSYEE